MKPIKKILAPTDLSESSQAGVRYALELAKALDAEVTVYHVVTYEDVMRYSQEFTSRTGTPSEHFLRRHELSLSRYLKDHFAGPMSEVQAHQKVEFGNPEKNIIDEAKEFGADLIVISTHGRTGLSHMLLGSVTEKVVRLAPCPVLSINPRLAVKAREKTPAVA